MLQYVARRVLLVVPILLAVIFITYALAIYGGGDPIETLVGATEARGNEALIEQLRHRYGYDRPFLVQYADYVAKFFTGDWGTSFQLQKQSVWSLIFRALPISFQLGLVALPLLLLLGVPLGILAAVKQNTWIDRLVLSFSILTDAMPPFVFAPMFLVIFVLELGVIDSAVGWDGIFSQKIILPAFVMALGPMLVIVRQTRFAVIEVMQQDYVRTARAKGLHNRSVILQHMLRNALQPVVTLAGVIAAYMVAGSIFIEQIFGIPGFGQLVYTGLRLNDLPLLMATTIVGAVIVLLSNLVVDLVYVMLDPRIKYR